MGASRLQIADQRFGESHLLGALRDLLAAMSV
jgi:hypothetical protein